MKKPKIKPSKALSDLRTYRGTEPQAIFWPKFGVMQSAGSRYETMRKTPAPLSILLVLHEQGIVTDEHLAAALLVAQAPKQ